MFKSKLIMEKETARGKNMLVTFFVRKRRQACLQQHGTAFVPGFLQQSPAAHVSLLTTRCSLIRCPLLQEPGISAVGHDASSWPRGSPSHARVPAPGDRCKTFPQEDSLYHKICKISLRLGRPGRTAISCKVSEGT